MALTEPSGLRRHVRDRDLGKAGVAMALAMLTVLAAVVAGLQAEDPGVTNPVALDRLSRLLADHATVDDELTLSRMVALGGAVLDGTVEVAERGGAEAEAR